MTTNITVDAQTKFIQDSMDNAKLCQQNYCKYNTKRQLITNKFTGWGKTGQF